jgi:predicted DNA-binding transcriptional regulator AlpA
MSAPKRKKRTFPKPRLAVPPPAPFKASVPIKYLSKKQVMDRLPITSHVSLWSWIKAGDFPPPRVVGKDGGHRSALGWIEEEVENYLANRPVRLPKGSTVTP